MLCCNGAIASTVSTINFGHNYSGVQAKTITLWLENTLDRLPYDQDAVFNSAAKQHEPACLLDTCVDLLDKIYSWADGPDARCIFWLSSLAGTGKSTIARTVARRYHDRQRLAASFFFLHSGGNVSHAGKFVTSITVQLAHSMPASRQHISNAIAEHSDIVSQSLGDQWRHLVRCLLSKLHEPEPYIVVVDALDECDNDNNIRIIVQLLAEAQSLAGARLRVFVTSRPEEPIHYGFVQVPHTKHQDFALHCVSPLVVNNDIRLFLEHELWSITQKRRLGTDWPGAQVIAQLVESASRLFIWAATAYRFIEDGRVRRVINDRLQTILWSSGPMSGPEEHLNKIYITVLTSSILITFTKEEKEGFRFRARSTASFGDLVSEDDVEDILQGLHAILDIPESLAEPLRLHHPSFRNFLLNKDRCCDANFWVEEKRTHEKLAFCCLELMSVPDGLWQDMCSLSGPGALRSEINTELISNSLPPELQYACRYWGKHIERGQHSIADGDTVHVFLQTHLLH
ncbi:hypothetical protein EK21DRAFT_109743 [Setomelanomma holmii]|uniref:Nephrocystin 3-like N-terminal domain-containing protein n=1 Tax=Setomelanomma holmii TaxID=210430 RepID=A0A9P4LMH0_9PLEO|nr:hypothetical protein EK21DRAFT_109743 [Setomelanomma holmii]